MERDSTVTICATTGAVLTETIEGITMPADYTFALMNDYVHGTAVNFEDLQALCLGMACEIESLRDRATCGCGDMFTEHDPGTCANCLAGMLPATLTPNAPAQGPGGSAAGNKEKRHELPRNRRCQMVRERGEMMVGRNNAEKREHELLGRANALEVANKLAARMEADAQERADFLLAVLKDIGDFAHDRSTGPAVEDALWEVRRMAYEAMTTNA